MEIRSSSNGMATSNAPDLFREFRPLVLLLCACLAVWSFDLAVAVPAFPDGVEVAQPATTFQLFSRGDEFFSWHETADGYAVMQDPADGFWKFARPAADRAAFIIIPEARVGWVDPADYGMERHALPDAELLRALREARSHGGEPVEMPAGPDEVEDVLPDAPQGVPAFPGGVEVAQPATTFLLFLRGDEFFSWHETADGYAVMQDPADGFWKFARPSVDRAAFVIIPEARVGSADPADYGLKKNALPDPELLREHFAVGCFFGATGAWSQVWTPPPEPDVPPRIGETYSTDENGDGIDDVLFEKIHTASPAQLEEMLKVELVFKEQITQAQIDAFLALGGEIIYVYRAVSYGWNGYVPLGNIPAVRDAMGDTLVLIEEPKPTELHMDQAASFGDPPRDTVGTPWTGQPGITETVQQLMDREAQAREANPCRSPGASPLDETVGTPPPESDVSGDIEGTPWTGQPGITESVQQLMDREAQARETHPRLCPEASPLDEASAPKLSQWPAAQPGLPRSVTAQSHSPQTVGTSFLAAQYSESWLIPPDSMGAVGPSQVLVIVNGRIKVFDKSGNLGPLNMTTDNFFNSVRSADTCDPHVRYDRLSQRWFITMIDVAVVNRILIAVSSGPTITGSGSFTFFQFQHDLVGTTPNVDTGNFADYDTLGVDRFALYIGANIFAETFVNTTGYVVNKANLIAGTLTVTPFRNLLHDVDSYGILTPQGVNNDDPNATEGYFIGHRGRTDVYFTGSLAVRRISNPGGTPSISGHFLITVPTMASPISQVHRDNTLGKNLDAIDPRLFAAHIKMNTITGTRSLWTAHNIQVDSSGIGSSTGGRNGSRWYEIGNLTTTPTLIQAGTLFDSAAANPRGFWMPSVAASGQGHMALGCSYASVNDFAGVAVAGRFRTDALGSIQPATLAVVSSAAYNLNEAPNPHRWGDFSQTVVDPNDDMTMWTFQEYCNANNSWGVRAIRLDAPPPATPATASPSTVVQGLSSANVVITGTSVSGSEFFDPGADTGGPGFANHLAAVVNGGGVIVNSVTFSTPTSISINVTVAPEATTGPRTITVTNPDDQIATSTAGILTITPPPTVTLSLSGSPMTEAGGEAMVTATLSAPSEQPVTVNLTFSGTATLTTDYTRSGTSITIPPGSLSESITLTAVHDTLYETDETIVMDIDTVVNGTENGVQQVTGTITDDDPPPTVTLSLQGSPMEEGGGVATVTATLSALSGPVTVNLAFSGTATLTSDFSRSGTSITIPAGSLSGAIALVGVEDALGEGDETIVVDIDTVVNGTENGVQQVTVTILDTIIADPVTEAIDRGIAWLCAQQQHLGTNPEQGYWSYHVSEGEVGITAMAALTLLNYGADPTGVAPIDVDLKEGLEFILNQRNPDGSIGDEPNDSVYETSAAIWPLVAAWNRFPTAPDRDLWGAAVTAGADYLKSAQHDAGGYSGGWGYSFGDKNSWADLSNTQYALLALWAAEEAGLITFDTKAAATDFVLYCQLFGLSLPEIDGGFTYQHDYSPHTVPTINKPYGSMSAAGVWSLYCCDVQSAAHPKWSRVLWGMDWLKNSVGSYQADPGTPTGQDWYYYYLMALSKAFVFYPGLAPAGWYADLSSQIIQIDDGNPLTQNVDGSWGPTASIYFEGEPKVFATVQALLALQTQATVFTGWMEIVLSTHADLHVYDPSGRHVGLNYETGEVDVEIPGATYSRTDTEPQVITIPDVPGGAYTITTVGNASEWYTLTVATYLKDKLVNGYICREEIGTGETKSHSIIVASIIGPLGLYTDFPPRQPAISATVDFGPEMLNLRSNGRWVTCYIELPDGYDAADIDLDTIRVTGIDYNLGDTLVDVETYISSDPEGPAEAGDHDRDGIPDLMVKFDREELQNNVDPAEELGLVVEGYVGSAPFMGRATIRAIETPPKGMGRRQDLQGRRPLK